jgi:hypothetical protein
MLLQRFDDPEKGVAEPSRAELAGLSAQRIEALLGRDLRGMRVHVEPLCGGLESSGVSRITLEGTGDACAPASLTFVVKELEGLPAREAVVYEQLHTSGPCDFVPGLLGVDRTGPRCRLFLEAVDPSQAWPWQDVSFAGQVLELLARLHVAPPPGLAEGALSDWDYEASLEAAAGALLEFAPEVAKATGFVFVKESLPALRRLVAELGEVRRALLEFTALEPTLIHGDVHPGNVVITRRAAGEIPLLLDWGRARVGSPLEDVSSWLQSLGLWEPQARRRHDTLLCAYLAARGLPPRLDRELRDMYWLAGACNLLAGAVLHHLGVAVGARGRPDRRGGEGGEGDEALRAARHWLRVIRRADACWMVRKRAPRGLARRVG